MDKYKMRLKDQDRELIEKFVNKVPLFRKISEKYLEQIIDDFSILHAQKNEVLLCQEDESTDLYIILRGKVKVTLMSKEGEEYILTELKEGDYFGEMSLIDNNPRSASVIAKCDSTFGVLKREKLLQAIKHDPMIAIDLLRSLVHRLRQSTEREQRFAFLDVRKRLIKLFEKLVETEEKREENGFYKIEKRTHKELAVRIGASREAISKVLKVLASEQVIIEKDDSLLISHTIYEKGEEI